MSPEWVAILALFVVGTLVRATPVVPRWWTR
jgi:hypothetical protein